jgi:hypothetical protein
MLTRIPKFLFLLLVLPTILLSQVDIFPLKDIRRGLKGEWRTVVAGSKVESFQLQILGVQKNFAGPRRPVIIAEALDERNKLSGPVAGMSGSPVYIDGKLVGAYAYGFMMAKSQAIIGITPIEQMLEVIENYGIEPLANGSTQIYSPEEESASVHQPLSTKMIPFLQPLPTPMFVSGFSKKTLKMFTPELEQSGMLLMAAPSAGESTSENLIDPPLEPGTPVAGVFMDGDFSVTGVGTITWKKGNKLLGFGHPFLQDGAVEIPMAGAEVLTVVQSIQRSFKLSNVGKVKGTIYQDRLTAIAGEIGLEIPRTDLSIRIEPANRDPYTLQSKVAHHARLTPNFIAMALAESLSDSMNTEAEQSFEIQTKLHIPNYEPLVYQDYGSGSSAIFKAAFALRSAYSQIINNPFETPRIPKVEIDIKIRNSQDYSVLKKISLRSTDRPRGGQIAKLGLEIAHHKQPNELRILEVPIPEGHSGDRLVLWVGDAKSADDIDLPSSGDITSLNDIIDRLRYRRSNNQLHIKFLKSARGLNINGAILPELPPSVYDIYTSDTRGEIINTINMKTVWETQIPVEGAFQGSYSYPLDIR